MMDSNQSHALHVSQCKYKHAFELIKHIDTTLSCLKGNIFSKSCSMIFGSKEQTIKELLW